MLLRLLHHIVGVKGSFQVSVNLDGGVLSLLSPVVHDQLLLTLRKRYGQISEVRLGPCSHPGRESSNEQEFSHHE